MLKMITGVMKKLVEWIRYSLDIENAQRLPIAVSLLLKECLNSFYDNYLIFGYVFGDISGEYCVSSVIIYYIWKTLVEMKDIMMRNRKHFLGSNTYDWQWSHVPVHLSK